MKSGWSSKAQNIENNWICPTEEVASFVLGYPSNEYDGKSDSIKKHQILSST